jgi:hypothetical protein
MLDRRAAIVCEHVANGCPILRAVKDEPLEPADSGWQFVCNSGVRENEETAKVWAVHEVLEVEPTLAAFIEKPAGTILERKSANASWEMLNP